MKQWYLQSLFFMATVYAPFAHALFEYDQAVYAAQCGKWDKACTNLKSVLVNKPHDPAVLYDLGVGSYKMKEYERAQAYFEDAASSEQSSPALQERAYFNAGNAAAQQKKLDDAIGHYERALALDPGNERVQHNLDIVKKMREQQKQDEKQKKDNQKQQQQKQDDQSKKDKDNNTQRDQSDDKNDENQQEGNQGDNQDGQKDQKQQDGDNQKQGGNEKEDKQDGSPDKENNNQQKQGDQQDKADKGDKNNQQQEDRTKKEQQPGSSQQQEQQKQQPTDKSGEQEKNDRMNNQEKKKEEAAPQKKDAGQENQQEKEAESSAQEKEGMTGADRESFNKVDRWLADILKKREKDDAALNKQMIRSTVEKQLVGRNGQNCW